MTKTVQMVQSTQYLQNSWNTLGGSQNLVDLNLR